MRENRPYGLAGGETDSIGLPYLDRVRSATELQLAECVTR